MDQLHYIDIMTHFHVTCCRCNKVYNDHRGSDTDIRINPYDTENYHRDNVIMVCGFSSDWDEAILTFRKDKKPIMDGIGATWDQLKANPNLSWVKKAPSDLCNKCIVQLIKDKDIEFTSYQGSVWAIYPTYCDICNRYFDRNQPVNRCDAVVFRPRSICDWDPIENKPIFIKPKSTLMIGDYRNGYIHKIPDKEIPKYDVQMLDLGNAKRHYGRVCNNCMDNIVLRELGQNSIKMDSQLQREIHLKYVEMQCRPGGGMYQEAMNEFYTLDKLDKPHQGVAKPCGSNTRKALASTFFKYPQYDEYTAFTVALHDAMTYDYSPDPTKVTTVINIIHRAIAESEGKLQADVADSSASLPVELWIAQNSIRCGLATILTTREMKELIDELVLNTQVHHVLCDPSVATSIESELGIEYAIRYEDRCKVPAHIEETARKHGMYVFWDPV